MTISSPAGLNTGNNPSVDAGVVTVLLLNETVRAIGRTADSRWIQVLLPDQTSAWVATEFVISTTGLAGLLTIGR